MPKEIDKPHETKDGYCCACEYDIAGFKEKISEARDNGFDAGCQYGTQIAREARKKAIEECIGMVKKEIHTLTNKKHQEMGETCIACLDDLGGIHALQDVEQKLKELK